MSNDVSPSPLERAADLPHGGLLVHAPAKINLNLRVGPRRADGYHDLDSFVAKVTLYDRIELRPGGEAIRLTCHGADCGPVRKNLAYRAAELLCRAAPGRSGGVTIDLTKAIGPGKGLGGGSSDAAAVLWGLNRLWRLGLPAGRLKELAMELGSDVPLFLGPPASRMTGRGEELSPIEVHPFRAVLLLSDCFCSTADVYRVLDEERARSGGGSESHSGMRGHDARDPSPYPLPQGERGEEKDARATNLRGGAGEGGGKLSAAALRGPVDRWRGLLGNDLGGPARRVCPELAAIWDRVSAAVAQPVCLTGSGSALFVLCGDDAEAVEVVTAIQRGQVAIMSSFQYDDSTRRDARVTAVAVRDNPW